MFKRLINLFGVKWRYFYIQYTVICIMICGKLKLLVWMLATSAVVSCQSNTQQNKNNMNEKTNYSKTDTITLGGGCFWCLEAVYKEMKGIKSITSGYAGGFVKNPTYNEVCSGNTGHAEVVQISFDTSVTTLEEVLEVFWRIHDPTTLNRQGADQGTQYRSCIYYTNEDQKNAAFASMQAATEAEFYTDSFVTEIKPLDIFYTAEAYHQNYYSTNPNQSYCVYVVGPKVDKFKKLFKEKLKQ